jgi:DNA-directed RNA polymerases I, II, and III subunit RPABC2
MSDELDFENEMNENNVQEFEQENDMILEDENIEDIEDAKIINYSNVLDATVEMKKKRTNPYLTKYEKARIIGIRAQQIASGSIPLVDSKGLVSPISIALKELKERKIPFIIRRKLPNNTYEDWTIEELKF